MPMEVFCRMTIVRRVDLSCVVQAGGLSSRMGRDKARMTFCGEPLIERVLGRLATVAGELVVTTSRPSELAYLEERTFGGLVPRIVSDLEGPAGAMRGIASSLAAARLPFVAIVACDMPFVSPELIGALADRVEAEALDVCVPCEERGIEPLCAVWRRDACAPAAHELLACDRQYVRGAALRLLVLTQGVRKSMPLLLKAIGDFERISDHAVNVLESAEELREKGLAFSDEAKRELSVLSAAVNDILMRALDAFRQQDMTAARQVEPLEQVIDNLKEQLRTRHILRMQQGQCSIEAGFVWSDLLTDLERTSDHCSNIAGCVIDAAHHDLNMHATLDAARHQDPDFREQYRRCAAKYQV